MKRLNVLLVVMLFVLVPLLIAARVYYVPDISVRDGAWCDVRSYGAIGDGATADTAGITAAVTAAANNTVYFSEGTYRLDADLTVPANVTLHFANGAGISVDAGDTLTINGAITAPVAQVFSGSGSIAGSPLVDFVRPEWWGAVADGATDCSTALDTAINFADSSGIKAVQLQGRNYYVASALSYSTLSGITILGSAGKYTGTTITYDGIGTTTNALTFTNCDFLRIENIYFTTTGTQAKSGLCVATGSSDGTFVNLSFNLFTTAGIYLDTTGGSTWYHQFIGCRSYNSDYGVLQQNGVSNSIQFIGGRYASNDVAGIAIRGQNHLFQGVDLESNPVGLTTTTGDAYTSRGWVVENIYLENMGSDPGVYVANLHYSRFGPNFVSSGFNELEFGGDNIKNTVVNWMGNVKLAAANCQDNVLVSYSGTLVDNGSDNVDLQNGLVRRDGTQELTANWDVGDYNVSVQNLVADLASVVDSSGTPALGPTIVTNGKFTVNTTGWTADDATLTSEAGGQDGNCLKITNTAVASGRAEQMISVDVGATYKLTWYFKLGDRVNSGLLVGTTQWGSDLYSVNNAGDVAWTERTAFFTATTGTIYVWAYVNSGQIGYYGYFDEISIERVNQGDMAVGNYFSTGGNANIGGVLTPGSLIMPSGITPTPATEGALFFDTDESANGSLMMYGNGAWRKVMDLP